MIESISLRNFLSHEDTSITLEDGINVFVGANGAGKSSVIDAITYALYGKHTRERDRNLLRRGASWGAVTMAFTYGQSKYIIERKLGPNGRLEGATLRQAAPVQRLLVAGERRQYGESVSDSVSSLMRLDYDKMKVAAIIQQGELDSIIHYRPSEFKGLMDSLIGIDRLGNAYEAMRDPMDGFRERLRGECMGKYDDRNYQQLLDDIEEIDSGIKENTKNVEIAGAQLKEAKERHEGLKLKVSKLEPLKVKKDELATQRRQLESYIDKLVAELSSRESELKRDIPTAKKMLATAASLMDAQAELDTVTSEIKSLSNELASIGSTISVYERSEMEIKRINNEIEAQREKRENVSKKMEKLEMELSELNLPQATQFPENLEEIIDDLQSKRDELREKLSVIKEKIKNFNEIKESGVCPTCDSDAKTAKVDFKLSMASSQLQSVTLELNEVESSLKEKKETLKQMNEYKRKLDIKRQKETMRDEYEAQGQQIDESINKSVERMMELEGEAANLIKMKEEYAVKRAALNELESKEKEIRQKLLSANRAKSWLEAKGITSQSSIDSLNAELESIKKKVQMVSDRSNIANMAIDEYSSSLVKNVQRLEDETRQYDEGEYLKLKNEERESEVKLNEIDGQIRAMGIRGKELERTKGELESVRLTVEKAKKYIQMYDRIRNEIYSSDGSLATSLRSWAIRMLSFYASEYIRSFGIGVSEIRLGEKKRDVSIECYSGYGTLEIGSMSGGESVAVALAIRFAMAKLMGMGMIDFIILDEPTVYLDEERKSSLVNIISGFNAGSGSIKQMIIITHDREIFENSSVDAMFQFEKHNGVTNVTKS